jgi:hypothetical protein
VVDDEDLVLGARRDRNGLEAHGDLPQPLEAGGRRAKDLDAVVRRVRGEEEALRG